MDKLIYQSKLRFTKRVKKLSVGIERSIFRIADVIFDVPLGLTSGKIHEKPIPVPPFIYVVRLCTYSIR